jgi:hypothetical protein
MAISPVSSGSSNIAALQSQSQSPQVREKEGVNTSGQVVGSIINVQA